MSLKYRLFTNLALYWENMCSQNEKKICYSFLPILIKIPSHKFPSFKERRWYWIAWLSCSLLRVRKMAINRFFPYHMPAALFHVLEQTKTLLIISDKWHKTITYFSSSASSDVLMMLTRIVDTNIAELIFMFNDAILVSRTC